MRQDLRGVSAGGVFARYLDNEDPGPRGTLLLLHAFPLGTGMWVPQLDAFPGWRVVAPAMPGFDGVPPPAEPSVDGFARHAFGVADALGLDRVVCAGVSMGGYVALAAARLAPGRLAGVVLADTRAGADAPDARAGREAMRDALRREGPASVAASMEARLLGATTRASRPDVTASVRGMIERQTAEGIDAAIRALMGRPDATGQLAGIAAPTLVVVGEEDTLTPPVEAERLRDGIVGARLERIPGAGHLASLERPEAFNAALGAFLNGLAG